GNAPDLEAVEWVVSGPRMQAPFVKDSRSRWIEQHQIGIAADRDRALLWIEAEDSGRVRRKRADEGVYGHPSLADTLGVDHLHLRREPWDAVRYHGEIVCPRGLLLHGPRRVIAPDRLDVSAPEPVPQGRLVCSGAKRRGAHDLRRLCAAGPVAFIRQRQADRAGLGPHAGAGVPRGPRRFQPARAPGVYGVGPCRGD